MLCWGRSSGPCCPSSCDGEWAGGCVGGRERGWAVAWVRDGWGHGAGSEWAAEVGAISFGSCAANWYLQWAAQNPTPPFTHTHTTLPPPLPSHPTHAHTPPPAPLPPHVRLRTSKGWLRDARHWHRAFTTTCFLRCRLGEDYERWALDEAYRESKAAAAASVAIGAAVPKE